MANPKIKGSRCLICNSNISSRKVTQVDKLNALFLLHILLKIPQESQLVNHTKDWINLLQICDHCAVEIKQCKKIYSEICEKIEIFWGTQNKILKKVSKDQDTSKHKKDICDDDFDDWVFQCRKFVKDCNFTRTEYPFVVHDLKALLISTPSPPQHLQDEVNCSVKQDKDDTKAVSEIDDSNHILKDPFDEIAQPSDELDESTFIKQEPNSDDELPDIEDQEYQLDEDDNISSDEQSDYEPSTSKKPKLSPTKRRSPRKSAKQVKKPVKSTQINQKGSHPKISNIYPDFKRDPTTKKFHCTWPEDCTQKFGRRHDLKNHWDRHTGTPTQKCEECSQSFYSRRDLVCHLQKEHPKDGDKFNCENCGKEYKTKESLLEHQRIHHFGKKAEETKAKIKKKEEDPIKRDSVTNKFMCYWPDCAKSYLDRQDLKFHLDRHKGTPNQKCEECGQLFYSKCQLNRHTQKEHEKEEKFTCEICGEKFKIRSSLHQHRSYRHSESGTGIQVVCQICGKSFKKAILINHVRNVHGGVEERKFACHLCPGKFANSRVLKRHMWWIHQVCESEEWKETFLKERELEKARGYKGTCHVKGCRVRFTTEEGLRKHVDGVHQGNWDGDEDTNCKFNCEICGKGFHAKQKFTRHVKQHEKD